VLALYVFFADLISKGISPEASNEIYPSPALPALPFNFKSPFHPISVYKFSPPYTTKG
jgi:hypothetical protein